MVRFRLYCAQGAISLSDILGQKTRPSQRQRLVHTPPCPRGRLEGREKIKVLYYLYGQTLARATHGAHACSSTMGMRHQK